MSVPAAVRIRPPNLLMPRNWTACGPSVRRGRRSPRAHLSKTTTRLIPVDRDRRQRRGDGDRNAVTRRSQPHCPQGRTARYPRKDPDLSTTPAFTLDWPTHRNVGANPVAMARDRHPHAATRTLQPRARKLAGLAGGDAHGRSALRAFTHGLWAAVSVSSAPKLMIRSGWGFPSGDSHAELGPKHPACAGSLAPALECSCCPPVGRPRRGRHQPALGSRMGSFVRRAPWEGQREHARRMHY
jgi:hypothetical protein